MKQIEIKINNMVFDGRWLQWFYFGILDINDFVGRPILFNFGEGNTFKDFTFNYHTMPMTSSKMQLGFMIRRKIWKIRNRPLGEDDKSTEEDNEI